MVTTRERFITATTELLRRQGYNGTSLKEVTDAAGSPTGSLYHFFPDGKVGLAEAALLESGAAYQQLFEIIADEAGDPVAAVAAFFDGAADVLEANDYIDICPIGTVAREVASTHDRLRIATAGVFSGWIEALSARLRAEGLDGRAAEDLAGTVVATLEGAFILARATRRTDVVRSSGRLSARLVADCLEAASG
jgi:AcrR family transcriptional regulator